MTETLADGQIIGTPGPAGGAHMPVRGRPAVPNT